MGVRWLVLLGCNWFVFSDLVWWVLGISLGWVRVACVLWLVCVGEWVIGLIGFGLGSGCLRFVVCLCWGVGYWFNWLWVGLGF